MFFASNRLFWTDKENIFSWSLCPLKITQKVDLIGSEASNFYLGLCNASRGFPQQPLFLQNGAVWRLAPHGGLQWQQHRGQPPCSHGAWWHPIYRIFGPQQRNLHFEVLHWGSKAWGFNLRFFQWRRIGKKSEGIDKKNNLELELQTPKAPPLKPIPKKETVKVFFLLIRPPLFRVFCLFRRCLE